MIHLGNHYDLLLCFKSNSANNNDNILTQKFSLVDLKGLYKGQCHRPVVDGGEVKYCRSMSYARPVVTLTIYFRFSATRMKGLASQATLRTHPPLGVLFISVLYLVCAAFIRGGT